MLGANRLWLGAKDWGRNDRKPSGSVQWKETLAFIAGRFAQFTYISTEQHYKHGSRHITQNFTLK